MGLQIGFKWLLYMWQFNMKCYACDCILTPQESVRRFEESQEFVDLCNKRLTTIEDDVETVDGEYAEDDYEDQDE